MSGRESGKPTLVFVVDDDEVARATMRAALERDGLVVHECAGGLEALESFEELAPSLVVLDVIMPDLDGFATCKALRVLPGGAAVPILVTTGLEELEAIEKAYAAGATDFATKPLNPTILRKRVQYMLRAARGLADLRASERRLRAAKRKARRVAYRDPVTLLPNRNYLQRHAVKLLAGIGGLGALLSLDLDGFKRVNDTLGHAAGDDLLRKVALRLRECLRASDCVARPSLPPSATNQAKTLARFGGDEFVVILPNLRSPEDASAVAERILAALTRPFDVSGREIVISASIGVAIVPPGVSTIETVLEEADSAMYHAKANGRRGYALFSEELRVRVRERLGLEQDLRRALERDQLEVHYQPKVDATTLQAAGFEALVRWRHPKRGMVSPAEFIPIAEDAGLIADIGEWVLRTACAQVQALSALAQRPVKMAVNVSSRQFRGGRLVDTVRRAVEDAGISPSSLELEITESALMEDTAVASEIIASLRGMGVSIALDDFGTGYSSLGYLHRFPLDVLKIDRSFVRELTTRPESASIVDAIAALSKRLGLSVVAEGVEEAEQVACLRQLGCDEFQGFYFSRPLPISALREWLTQQRGAGAVPAPVVDAA